MDSTKKSVVISIYFNKKARSYIASQVGQHCDMSLYCLLGDYM